MAIDLTEYAFGNETLEILFNLTGNLILLLVIGVALWSLVKGVA